MPQIEFLADMRLKLFRVVAEHKASPVTAPALDLPRILTARSMACGSNSSRQGNEIENRRDRRRSARQDASLFHYRS